jgi:hypothetical protein
MQEFNSETPYNFSAVRVIDGITVEYRNLGETCQGGVHLGYLSVNGHPIGGGERFSGPPISADGYLYAPIDRKGWFKAGFVLCRIELKSGKLEEISELMGFMWLHKKEGNRIFFFEGVDRTQETFLEIMN